MTLRWKKHPRETGLSAVGCDSSKRGSNLHDGKGHEYASVYAHDYSITASRINRKSGWYWVASGHGIPHANTCNEKPLTEAEAKAQAMAYVKQHLKAEVQP